MQTGNMSFITGIVLSTGMIICGIFWNDIILAVKKIYRLIKQL